MTTRRAEFPDGNWLVIMDAADVTERERRPVLAAGTAVAALSAAAERATDAAAILALTEALVTATRRTQDLAALAALESWSYGPLTAETLADLPSLARDMVLDATAPTRDGMRWSLTDVPAEAADPKATPIVSDNSAPGWPTPTP